MSFVSVEEGGRSACSSDHASLGDAFARRICMLRKISFSFIHLSVTTPRRLSDLEINIQAYHIVRRWGCRIQGTLASIRNAKPSTRFPVWLPKILCPRIRYPERIPLHIKCSFGLRSEEKVAYPLIQVIDSGGHISHKSRIAKIGFQEVLIHVDSCTSKASRQRRRQVEVRSRVQFEKSQVLHLQGVDVFKAMWTAIEYLDHQLQLVERLDHSFATRTRPAIEE